LVQYASEEALDEILRIVADGVGWVQSKACLMEQMTVPLGIKVGTIEGVVDGWC
jgi:hypothetical protein